MKHNLLGWIFAAAISLALLLAIINGDFVTAGACMMLFFLAPLVGRPDICWMITIATLGCGLTLGLTGGASLHLLAMLAFISLSAIRSCVTIHGPSLPSAPRKACIALVIVIIVTASYRGWGLKLLDSALWGGMQYVSLLAALLFYILSNTLTVTQTQMRRTLRFFFALSLLPALALVMLFFIPELEGIRNIIQIGEAEEQQWQALEITRWGFMQYPAIWMGVLALLLYDRRFKFTPAVVAIAAFSFLMLGLSGHRTVTVLLGLTVLVYLTIKRRAVRLVQFLKFASLLIVLVIVLYLNVGHLPQTFQRALAWLPGIEVTQYAEVEAAVSSEWRIDMWRQLLTMVPDYLWIGRGLAFNASDVNAASTLASDRATMHVLFIAVHLYHNGPLWFLLDLGAAGFAAGLLFMLTGIIHYGRRLDRIADSSPWRSPYVVFYSLFVGYCIFFYSVIGGSTFLCHILVIASILEVIARSAEADDAKSKDMAPVDT